MGADISTDHRGLRVLALAECLQRLNDSVLGRVAFVHDGEPVILPVTIGLDGAAVVFRTSWGSKMQSAVDGQPVAVEVDSADLVRGAGWSVVVKGTASVVYDPKVTGRWERMGVPYWLHSAGETFWIRVTAEEISGRELVSPS